MKVNLYKLFLFLKLRKKQNFYLCTEKAAGGSKKGNFYFQ